MATNNTHKPIATCASQISSSSLGVMVSPGRMVNLSNTPPSLAQRIQSRIDLAMRRHGFKQNIQQCEDMIVDAIFVVRHYLAHPHHSYHGKKVTRHSFGTTRPKNRNQEGTRMYILAVLWRAWMLGTASMPKVNNRNYADTRFVKFAKEVTAIMVMGNVIKNLERYQSCRSTAFRDNEKQLLMQD